MALVLARVWRLKHQELIPATWLWWLVAFATFRFFDAVKPQPIKWFDQQVSGGFGVMLDDIIAALMSLLLLKLGAYLF